VSKKEGKVTSFRSPWRKTGVWPRLKARGGAGEACSLFHGKKVGDRFSSAGEGKNSWFKKKGGVGGVGRNEAAARIASLDRDPFQEKGAKLFGPWNGERKKNARNCNGG